MKCCPKKYVNMLTNYQLSIVLRMLGWVKNCEIDIWILTNPNFFEDQNMIKILFSKTFYLSTHPNIKKKTGVVKIHMSISQFLTDPSVRCCCGRIVLNRVFSGFLYCDINKGGVHKNWTKIQTIGLLRSFVTFNWKLTISLL